MRLYFLGTGTSTGIPVIGCRCPVCTSSHTVNQRTRSSLYVETKTTRFVIDSGPDFRLQALRVGLTTIDSVLYTHGHADHILGLDDLRPLSYEKDLDIWASQHTLNYLHTLFAYAFSTEKTLSSRPRLRPHLLEVQVPVVLGKLSILPLKILHGEQTILGFRWKNVAYLTDCSHIPKETWSMLKELDILILGAVRHHPHPMHFSVDQAIETALRIQAKQTFFTHISHEIDHLALDSRLPHGISLAYDGLDISLKE